jgi:hypothetical protein
MKKRLVAPLVALALLTQSPAHAQTALNRAPPPPPSDNSAVVYPVVFGLIACAIFGCFGSHGGGGSSGGGGGEGAEGYYNRQNRGSSGTSSDRPAERSDGLYGTCHTGPIGGC